MDGEKFVIGDSALPALIFSGRIAHVRPSFQRHGRVLRQLDMPFLRNGSRAFMQGDNFCLQRTASKNPVFSSLMYAKHGGAVEII